VSDSALFAHDRARGVRLIAGVDEVGRACLAGPIMAAGVLFDLGRLASGAGRDLLAELDDSKRLARTKRDALAQAILVHAEAVSLVSIPASQIDGSGSIPPTRPASSAPSAPWESARSFASWTAASRSALGRPCTSRSSAETRPA
jgi:Ribonuclease HII